MYLAICGHAKDLNRVFETEFMLLSIIAGSRGGGILQADLVRESSQDKRSVPKRTDALQQKGYIEKRAVHAHGSRTSRLFLRKFAASSATEIVIQRATAEDASGVVDQVDESIDFTLLIRNLFDILRAQNLVTRNDLKAVLGMTNFWRGRILARMIREFEILGCVQRVRAASEHSRKLRWHYACVKFIREPSEKDLQSYVDIASKLDGPAIPLDDDLDMEDQGDGPEIDQASEERASNSLNLQEVERIVPQWNPDRPIPNTISTVVHMAGPQGISNMVSQSNGPNVLPVLIAFRT